MEPTLTVLVPEAESSKRAESPLAKVSAPCQLAVAVSQFPLRLPFQTTFFGGIVVMTALMAGVAALVGSQQDILAAFNLPRLQIAEQTGTIATLIGIAIAAAVALVGAILGGLAGMRFHRKVDRTDVLDRSADR